MACAKRKQYRIGPTKLSVAAAGTQFDLLQSVDLLGFKTVEVTLTVLGMGGTNPSLAVTVKHAPENDAGFFNVTNASWSGVTTTPSTQTAKVSQFSRYLNFTYAMTGSSSPYAIIVLDVVARC